MLRAMRRPDAVGVRCRSLDLTRRAADAAFDASCNRCGPRRSSSACRARPSTRRRAGSSRICRCPTSSARTAGSRAAAAGRVRADAGRLRARRPRSRGSPRRARSCGSSIARRWRAIEQRFGVPPQVDPGDLGPRDRVRRPQAAAQRDPRAGDAGLSRAAQGHVPRRIPDRAEDPAGGPRHARRHAQLLGRRDGTHPVPAVRILQARRRFRRRRPARHLDLGAGCARLGGGATCRARAGSAASAGPTRCARRADIDCTIAEPSVTLPIGEWLKRGYAPAYGRKLTRR